MAEINIGREEQSVDKDQPSDTRINAKNLTVKKSKIRKIVERSY
jgi:hypothetical protein